MRPRKHRARGAVERVPLVASVTVEVEIWSDIVCPWCHVGTARFDEALRRLGWGGDDVEVTMRPFELDPHVPPGGVELGTYLRRKFGSAATVEAVEGRVAEAGAEVGLAFDWSRVRRVNTFDAHRLVEWALATAGRDAHRRLDRRLKQAYFAEGGDVADHAQLAALAGDAGLAPGEAGQVLASGAYGEEVRAGEREAADLDIHAVPTFVVERRLAIPGAQDPATFVQVLARLRSRLAT